MKHAWIAGLGIWVAIFLFSALPGFGKAAEEEDQITHPSCLYCGMDRTKFAQSRALITYDDGTAVGTCSLHCAAVDMSLKIDKTPVSIQVADYGTEKLIDVETANWVIGGSKPGVMTRRAKWAFASQTSADAFIAANGGSAGAFEVAVKAAFEDMYADLQMIREKRKMMRDKKKQ